MAPSASIPFRPSDDVSLPSGAPTALLSILTLALLAGALVLLKRRVLSTRRRGEPQLLEVSERCALTPNTQLVVTRYAGRRLLLSVGPTGTELLRDDAEKDTP